MLENRKVHIVLLTKMKHWNNIQVSIASSLHRDKENAQKQIP